MAKCTMKMPDDFMSKISTLGNKTDEVMANVLEVGAEVVEKEVKSNLSAVIGSGTKLPSKSTGQLEKALGVTPVLIDKDGNSNIKIGFSEPRVDGDSNAKIANMLEYGTSKMQAKPFLAPAKSKSRTPCKKAMIQKLEEELSRVK